MVPAQNLSERNILFKQGVLDHSQGIHFHTFWGDIFTNNFWARERSGTFLSSKNELGQNCCFDKWNLVQHSAYPRRPRRGKYETMQI